MKHVRKTLALVMSAVMLMTMCGSLFGALPAFAFDNTLASGVDGGISYRVELNGDVRWCYTDGDEWVLDESEYGAEGTYAKELATLLLFGEGDMCDYDYGWEPSDMDIRPAWDEFRDRISEIVVGDGITDIGEQTFKWYPNLKKVTLPEGLVRIGTEAFRSCAWIVPGGDGDEIAFSMESIAIPSTVTYIGADAFANVRNLRQVDFAGDLAAVCVNDDGNRGEFGARRLRQVFDETAWFDKYVSDNCFSGACGDGLTWKLEPNEEGFLADNETGEKAEVNDPEKTHWEPRFTLTISGSGAMTDYDREWDSADPVIPGWDFFRDQTSRLVVEPGVTRIGDQAFRWMPVLRSVTLPEGLVSIGEMAFENCQTGHEDEAAGWVATASLGSIVIPSTVTELDSEAFARNCSLDTVSFAGDLGEVCCVSARYGDRYTTVSKPGRLGDVFRDTPWLDKFIAENYLSGACGEGVTWAIAENDDGGWFDNRTGEAIPGPAEDSHYEKRYTLTIGGAGAMEDYDREPGDGQKLPGWDYRTHEISRVVVETGVTRIGDQAFRWSSRLKDVSLPEGLVSIGEQAFESCQDGREDAFGEWHPFDSIREITIPSTVTELDREAFARNCRLDTVNFAGDLGKVCVASARYGDEFKDREEIDRIEEVFKDTGWFEEKLASEYMSGTCGEGLTWKITPNEDGWYDDETGVRVEAEGLDGTHYEQGWTLTISGTGAIEDYMLDEKIQGVKTPGWTHFRGGITRIVVEEGVTRIGDQAFRWTPHLKDVSLPDSLVSIGEMAFESCQTGQADENGVWQPFDSIWTVTIPAGVKEIDGEAFAHNCRLETVNFTGDLAAVCCASARYGDSYENASEMTRLRDVFRDTAWFEDYEMDKMHGTCGENVTWMLVRNADSGWYENGTGKRYEEERPNTRYVRCLTLTISGTGDMYDYTAIPGYEDNRPWMEFLFEITAVEVLPGVTRIGDQAFRGFHYTRSVLLPEGLKSIGERAFEDLAERALNEETFGFEFVDSLREVRIPSTVTAIEDAAFTENPFLKTVEFDGDLGIVCLAGGRYPEYVKLSPQKRVQRVFDESLWYTENYLQGDCGEELDWHAEMTEILVDVKTGRELVDPSEFRPDEIRRERLQELFIDGNGKMPRFGKDPAPWAHEIDRIGKVHIGALVKDVDAAAFAQLTHLRTFVVDPGNKDLKTIDGVLYSADGTELIAYPMAREETAFEAPCAVRVIRDDAIRDARLHMVSLPGAEDVWPGVQNKLPTGSELRYRPTIHVWGEGVAEKAATCTENGLVKYTCRICGEVKTEETEKLAHQLEILPAKNATCTEPGLTQGSVCTVCGTVVEAQRETSPLGHSPETVPGVNATCTEPGLTEGSVCRVCGTVLKEQQELPALGHVYVDGVCTICGARRESLPVTPKPDSGAEVDQDKSQIIVGDGKASDMLEQLENVDGATIKDGKGDELAADALPGTGATLTTADGKVYTVIVRGDIDGNGRVTAGDARTVLRASAKLENLSDAQFAAANIAKREKLTAGDARKILRYSARLETAL